MIRSRFGLLGLSAVLFGVMAFGTGAAQAEVGSHFWILNGGSGGGGEKIDSGSLKASVGLEKEGTYVLHSKILGVAVLFLCTELKAVNAVLEGEGKIGSGGKVLFSGCTTDLNGTANAACVPKDTTEGVEGTILTQPLHSLVILGEAGETLLNVLPDTGETFANIEMGSKCPIGTKVPVIGKLAFKDCEGKAKEHLVKHLLEPAPASFTELWTISKTVEHQATLLGSAWAFLVGAHTGLKFGIEATEAGSHFWILNGGSGGGEKIDSGTLHATMGLTKDTAVNILHSKILGIAVLFLCTELKARNATLEGEGKISNGFKILFSGCTTDLNGTANASCTPKDAATGEEGTILTQGLHSLVILGEGGETLLNVLPDVGEIYITMEMGSKCPIGTKVPVIGKLALKDCEGKAKEHLVKHLLEPAPAPFTELWTISKTVEHQATLLGSFWMFLTGAHTGLTFSAEAA